MWNDSRLQSDSISIQPFTRTMSGFLKIENLSKAYSATRPVFADVSFTLDRGEFVCIIGHSGC